MFQRRESFANPINFDYELVYPVVGAPTGSGDHDGLGNGSYLRIRGHRVDELL